MSKDKKRSKPPQSSQESFDEIVFGPEDEMDIETADNILESHNISGAELIEEFKLRLQAELRSHFEKTNEVSKPLESALKEIRQQQRASEPKPIQAHSWIGDLLSGDAIASGESKLLYSWHKQKEGLVSDNDKRILDDLERELRQSE
jgi:hypothetical protein